LKGKKKQGKRVRRGTVTSKAKEDYAAGRPLGKKKEKKTEKGLACRIAPIADQSGGQAGKDSLDNLNWFKKDVEGEKGKGGPLMHHVDRRRDGQSD